MSNNEIINDALANIVVIGKEMALDLAKAEVEISNLRAELNQLRTELEQARAGQPCGHALAYIASSDEGTQYCRKCAGQKAA